MLGHTGITVPIRLLRDIEDRIVVFRKGQVIHVSREAAAVLVREGIGQLLIEQAVVYPQETRTRE
jgi:hypothetical protein